MLKPKHRSFQNFYRLLVSSVSSQQAHVVHPNEPRTAETQKHQRQGAIWQPQVAVLGWGPFCRWGISFQSCQGSPGPLRRKPLHFRCLNRDQPPPKLCRAMSSALLTQLPTHVLLYADPAFLPGVWKRLIQQISETRAASHRTPNAHLCGPRASLCAFSSLVLGSDSCVSPQGRSTREMGLRGRVRQRGVKGRGPGPSANGRNGGSSPGPRWGEGRGGRAAPRLPALLLPGSRRHGCRRAVGEDRPHCPQRGLNAGALPAPHRWGGALVAPGREGCRSGPVRAVPAGRRRCTTACPASAGCGVALGGSGSFGGSERVAWREEGCGVSPFCDRSGCARNHRVLFYGDDLSDLQKEAERGAALQPTLFVALLGCSVLLYFRVSLMDPGFVRAEEEAEVHHVVNGRRTGAARSVGFLPLLHKNNLKWFLLRLAQGRRVQPIGWWGLRGFDPCSVTGGVCGL